MQSISRTITQQEATHTASLQATATTLANHEAVQQQLLATVAQIAGSVGATLTELYNTHAATTAALQDRINQLEAQLAALAKELQNLKP
jgi:chromosome segregation ATPase